MSKAQHDQVGNLSKHWALHKCRGSCRASDLQRGDSIVHKLLSQEVGTWHIIRVVYVAAQKLSQSERVRDFDGQSKASGGIKFLPNCVRNLLAISAKHFINKFSQ